MKTNCSNPGRRQREGKGLKVQGLKRIRIQDPTTHMLADKLHACMQTCTFPLFLSPPSPTHLRAVPVSCQADRVRIRGLADLHLLSPGAVHSHAELVILAAAAIGDRQRPDAPLCLCHLADLEGGGFVVGRFRISGGIRFCTGAAAVGHRQRPHAPLCLCHLADLERGGFVVEGFRGPEARS
jgi:hypothetical protein